MPGRKIPLITNQLYHVFNRGIDGRRVFKDDREYIRGIIALDYYRFIQQPVKLSRLGTMSEKDKEEILKKQKVSKDSHVDIACFCLMPNHFHLLLRQKVDGGISKFISNFQNSYTRYFNTKNERKGQLFLNRFRARRLYTEEELIHLFRYILLNPYSSGLVNNFDELKEYPWSSFDEYVKQKPINICEIETMLERFGSREKLVRFVLDNADYQKNLEKIKHLIK